MWGGEWCGRLGDGWTRCVCGGGERVTQGRGRAPRLGQSRSHILRGTGEPQRSCRSKGEAWVPRRGCLRGPIRTGVWPDRWVGPERAGQWGGGA